MGESPEHAPGEGMHTLLFCEPGHFHAALTLRVPNARVAPDVHVYARPGPEREAFCALVETFNRRAQAPTAWTVHVHADGDPLGRLVAERRGDLVVIAGRNADKLATIAHLHRSGFHVLADKPWLVSSRALPDLLSATAGPPLAMDIMTSRFDTVARLRRRVARTAAVFGGFATDDPAEPAIEIGSRHHLLKLVDGRPLRRPAWYYDVAVQGDGLVDIQSHMVDQAQWLLEPSASGDAGPDLTLDATRRWPTPVPGALFAESTGEREFPAALASRIRDGVLALACNGELTYRAGGLRVRQRAEWGQREPAGGGDIHSAVLRGRRTTLRMRHGPETGFVPELHLEPRPGIDLAPGLAAAAAEWQPEFPGLSIRPSDLGVELCLPAALRTSHESHFAMVLDQFLDLIERAEPPAGLAARIRARYTLLAQAHERAVDVPDA